MIINVGPWFEALLYVTLLKFCFVVVVFLRVLTFHSSGVNNGAKLLYGMVTKLDPTDNSNFSLNGGH